jgi:hypothetical protein
MFIGDEVRAEVSPAAAAARLATLARGSSLTRASHAAWDTATASDGHISPSPGLPRLTRVHSQGPTRRGTAAVLMLRWEVVVAQGGRPFPALDADITLVPDGEHAVLVSLMGVCRQPPGTRPGQLATQTTAAAAIRSLLTRIAVAVSDPAAPALPDCPQARPGLDPDVIRGPRRDFRPCGLPQPASKVRP